MTTGLENPPPSQVTGQIVVKFLKFKDKVAVLERAKNLRGTYIFLNEVYPEAVRQKRKELIPAIKAVRARGDIADICYDRLIVHLPRSLEEMREPSLWVHSLNPSAHTPTHTYTHQLMNGLMNVYIFYLALFAIFHCMSISDKLDIG